MLRNHILIRYQSYEKIQLVTEYPNVSSGADENNNNTSNQHIINITLRIIRQLGKNNILMMHGHMNVKLGRNKLCVLL